MGGKKKWTKHPTQPKSNAFTQQLHTDYNGAYDGCWGPKHNDSAGSHGGRPTGTHQPESLSFRKSCLTDTLWRGIVKNQPVLGHWRNLLQAHFVAQERLHFSIFVGRALLYRAFSVGARATWERFLAAYFRRQVEEDIDNLLTRAMDYQRRSFPNCCNWARFTTYAARAKRRAVMVEQARAHARERLKANRLTLQ